MTHAILSFLFLPHPTHTSDLNSLYIRMYIFVDISYLLTLCICCSLFSIFHCIAFTMTLIFVYYIHYILFYCFLLENKIHMFNPCGLRISFIVSRVTGTLTACHTTMFMGIYSRIILII